MRSVDRGPWPSGKDGRPIPFPEYGHAKGPLIERIGEYCSYCERRGDLHVEHVVPKSVARELEKEWSNFLLGRHSDVFARGEPEAESIDRAYR